jgi:predicted signal transduction protein with EAL and GGDEF domain
LGGDEFAILLPDIEGTDDVEVIARRVVNILGDPYMIEGQRVIISASIGVAIAPEHGTSYETLLKNADMALYLAKREGRSTWRFFEAEMEVKLQARRAMELDLREALAGGQFEVFYQPIFDLSQSRIAAFEALVRWRHPERGLISPAEFIPLAEEMGLIAELGEWVLRQACSEAATWPAHTRVAVNVSAIQFKDDGLLDIVCEALAVSGLDAKRLELEVTETILLSDSENNLQTLTALRQLGICISMDDFGTGYSSLSYLGSFPFDKIKIDRSFVQSLVKNDGHRAIIRAMVALGSTLGIRAIAEGVETHEQLEWLWSVGCKEVQGFYFSPPVPSSELQKLIATWNGKRVCAPHFERTA